MGVAHSSLTAGALSFNCREPFLQPASVLTILGLLTKPYFYATVGRTISTSSCACDCPPLSTMDEAFAVGTLEPSVGLRRALTARDGDDHATQITDLPAAVLGSILAHLVDPVDVVSALCTCRLFWFLVRTAPFRLRLRPRHFDEAPAAICDEAPTKSGRVTPQTAVSWTRAALGAIRLHMCATRELDLAGCFIVDDDVAEILSSLRCLERLILDNCQKLTGAVADVLAASVQSGPISLSLQRCFGLGSSSSGNLLVASAADGSRLRSVLLSHIDSLGIPRTDLSAVRTGVYDCERDVTRDDSDLANSFGSISSGPGLRILALNNCAGLTASDLTSVAMLCPHLEFLLLGGSVQALGLSRTEAVAHGTISSTAAILSRVLELLPKLRVLELTFFTSAVVQAVRVQDKRKIQIWDLCEESSVAVAARALEGLKNVKPGYSLKHSLQQNASLVRRANIRETAPVSPVSFSKSIKAQFWQDGLTRSEGLSTGTFSDTENLASSAKGACLLYSPQSDDWWESSAEDVAFGLRAAANCSDVRKRTPLHIAAARGDGPMITDLLAIGAVAVGMKDSSGGTALFVAAESGYAHACELLLQGGADVLASNRAGETPLYISALRGHSAAVGIMLAHCHEHGVNWQDADVYGDGWTPLMAAAVADRRNVGEMLLRAAGNELGLGFTQKGQSLMSVGSSVGSTVLQEADELKDPDVAFDKDSPTDSKPGLFFAGTSAVGLAEDCNAVCTSQQLLRLLNRQNRYGQTALHIAVQKGSVWFIERLLSAGASLDVPNAFGLRAVDVAKRYNHAAIADKLRAWESSQPKETCMSGDKKSRQHRKRRGKPSKATSVHQNLREPNLNLDCSGMKAMAPGRHNCERPNCCDGAQSSLNVGDVQQEMEERTPEQGMFLFGTDVNPENGARSDDIAQNVRLSALEAILDLQSPVPR